MTHAHSHRGPSRWLGAATCALVVLLASPAPSRAANPPDDERGTTFYLRFQGSTSSLGQVMKLDPSLGYNFNRFFGLDVGLPVYFVRDATDGSRNVSGLGNAYVVLRLTVENPALNFISSVTATAPTGDPDKGLSTGRATYDWNNHFNRSFGPLTPFANLGVANTVSDTAFFSRPFTTLGTVGHFDAGASYALVRFLSVGASAYKIVPTGEQQIISRVVARSAAPVPLPAARGRVFETTHKTIGDAELARDHGVSTWLTFSPTRHFYFDLGYTRSIRYALDVVSFGLGVNVGSLVRRETRR